VILGLWKPQNAFERMICSLDRCAGKPSPWSHATIIFEEEPRYAGQQFTAFLRSGAHFRPAPKFSDSRWEFLKLHGLCERDALIAAETANGAAYAIFDALRAAKFLRHSLAAIPRWGCWYCSEIAAWLIEMAGGPRFGRLRLTFPHELGRTMQVWAA
jgi:hypothetical protein